MADYAPLYLYADQISGTASAAITGGQTLVVSGNGTVGPAGADAANFIGVAAMDAASGARVSYIPRGKVHVSTVAATVTAGQPVRTAANGQVTNTGSQHIGVFLTSAASGTQARWMEF